MAQVNIRLATEDDTPALVRLVNAAYRVEDFFVTGDRTSAQSIAAQFSKPNGCFFVVDGGHAGELAASVFVEVRGVRGYFGMLSVAPDYQGKGLGRLLVSAAEDYCRNAGCQFIDITVVNLRTELPPFYQALGYVPMGTAPFSQPARLRRDAHLILMSKTLR